jgi:predicted ATPase/DNA-binding CsgD family transcriptional regulator
VAGRGVGCWTFVVASGGDRGDSSLPEVLRTLVAHGGRPIERPGEDLWVAFDDAEAALRGGGAAQACRPDGVLSMAVHAGTAERGRYGYRGGALVVAGLVLDAANPGQTLVTAGARDRAPAMADSLVELGWHQLGDVIEPMRLFALVDERVAAVVRPPRARRLRIADGRSCDALFGRDNDVAATQALLVRGRLVTLTGLGGIGKTSLAVEVAELMRPEFRDGIAVARLETCASFDDVAAAVRNAIGIDARRGAGRSVAAVVGGLLHRHVLVVLDNCEHVLDAVSGLVTEVLEECPGVRLLATSREPLGLAGERVYRVPQLDTSDGGAATALFIDRAVRAGADARTIDGSIVGAICRRLDGVPLAVELAAARCRSIQAADLLDRLDDMSTLLSTTRRVGPARHRSLAAALRWSYDLLNRDEQVMLAASSVFAGSFGIDAATAVCIGSRRAANDVVGVLDRLVSRSLMVTVDNPRTSRFRLLEPVRQFARDELAAFGLAEEVRDRHADWFVSLMTDLGARWRAGDDQGTWPIAADELPNLRAAFDRLVTSGRIDDAQTFAVDALGPVDQHVDVVPEVDWAPRALAMDLDHVGPATAAACGLAAWGATDPTNPGRAAAWVQRGEAAVRRGSIDDGLLTAAAMHQVRFGCELAATPAFVTASIDAAAASDDLHRQVWVFAYTRHGDCGLGAAERLGNLMLLAYARLIVSRTTLEQCGDSDQTWEAIEACWDAAQGSNCSILLNHAAQMLADARIRAGAAIDGLLLLRAPVRDWYLEGDVRVWDTVHSIAAGLAIGGDLVGAARMIGALGQRRVPFATAGRRRDVDARIASMLSPAERRRHEREGRALDVGSVVAEAVDRIETLAQQRPPPRPESSALTGRQREIAELVAGGLTNKQIARALGLSRFTVETHVRNILDRLGASSRAQVAAWAVSTRHT